MLVRLLAALLFVCALAEGQNPTAHTPTSYVNAKYVNGVAPGYAPTQGSGLVLNIGPGSCFTGSGVTNYAGGTLTLTASTTNYVFVNSSTCAPAFNTTGFSSLPIAVVTTGGSAISLVTDERLTLNDSSSTLPFLQAASFTGATTNAQALTACQSLVGAPGVVIIAPTMAADTTPKAYPQGCTVEDLRGLVGPNQFGTEGTAYAFNHLFRETFRTAPNAVQNYGPIAVFDDDESGGLNTTGGPKTTYISGNFNHVSRTQGQHYGTQELMVGLGEGDQIGHVNNVYCFGGSNAGGDEGCAAFHLEADQGNGPLSTAANNLATATVSTATPSGGNTILALTSGVNLQLLGELHWLIDTTAGKVYSTGTVSGITGAPPVVTGSGTSWLSLTGGQYCFSLNGNSNGTLMQVIPIRTITDNTHFTLGYSVQGADKSFSGNSSTGAYQIFPCSQISPGGLPSGLGGSQGSPVTSASITVTNGYNGWAASDTVQLPLGFDTFIAGNFINIGPQLPMGIIPVGLHIVNLQSKQLQANAWGFQTGFGGWWSRHWECDNGSQATTFACLYAEDSVNPINYSVYNTQETSNTLNGWAWNSGTDVGKIGFDRTTGQFTVSDNTNGPLLEQDNSSGGFLHTGPTLSDLSSHQVVGNFTLTGWGSGSSVTAVGNDSTDEGGLIVIQSGTGLSTLPTVKMTLQHTFFAMACMATFDYSSSIGNALPKYNQVSGNITFVWPDNGLPSSAPGSTPPASSTIDLTWICKGLG